MEPHLFSRGDGSQKKKDIFLKTDAYRTTTAKRIVKLVYCREQLLR